MKLTDNFTLSEFETSNKARQLNINNKLPPHLMRNIQALAERLQLIRDALGRPITISSGYRCIELNKAVGGAATSQHILGLAADIVCRGLSAQALYEVILDLGVSFDQLIIEHSDGKEWVHISVQPSERNERLRYNDGIYSK